MASHVGFASPMVLEAPSAEILREDIRVENEVRLSRRLLTSSSLLLNFFLTCFFIVFSSFVLNSFRLFSFGSLFGGPKFDAMRDAAIHMAHVPHGLNDHRGL